MTRTASQRGRANRRQGRETERAVRDYLRAWWHDIDYTHPGGPGRTHSGDRGDLAPLVDRDGDHWTVEVKGWRDTQSAGVIDRACREAEAEAEANGAGGLWVCIVRRPGCADVGRWHAYLPVDNLLVTADAGRDTQTHDHAGITVRAWVALVAPEPF